MSTAPPFEPAANGMRPGRTAAVTSAATSAIAGRYAGRGRWRKQGTLTRCATAASTIVALVVLAAAAAAGAAILRQSRDLDETLRSVALSGRVHARVVLPPGYSDSKKRYPVVYFLHGLPANAAAYRGNDWLIDALERAGPAILVIPQGARVGDTDPEYLNWGAGRNWETYVATEVPRYVDAHFRTIHSRSGRAIVGVSAGGYGAMILGLHHLAEFSVIESWSGYFHPTDPTGTVSLPREPAGVGTKPGRATPQRREAGADVHRLLRRPGRRAVPLGQRAVRRPARGGTRPAYVRRLPGRHTTALWKAHGTAWLQLALRHLDESALNPRLTHPFHLLDRLRAYNHVRDAGTGAVLGPRGARRDSLRSSPSASSASCTTSTTTGLYRGFAPPRDAAFVKVEGTSTRFYVTSPALGGRRQPVDVYLPPGYAQHPRAALPGPVPPARLPGTARRVPADGALGVVEDILAGAAPVAPADPRHAVRFDRDRSPTRNGRTASEPTRAGRRSSRATSCALSTPATARSAAGRPRDRRSVRRRLRRDQHRPSTIRREFKVVESWSGYEEQTDSARSSAHRSRLCARTARS